MFAKLFKVGYCPQVSKVAYRDRQIKDIRYKVGRCSFVGALVLPLQCENKLDNTIRQFIFLHPRGGLVAGCLYACFFLNIYTRGMRKIQRIYPIDLNFKRQSPAQDEKIQAYLAVFSVHERFSKSKHDTLQVHHETVCCYRFRLDLWVKFQLILYDEQNMANHYLHRSTLHIEGDGCGKVSQNCLPRIGGCSDQSIEHLE
jgi:hypothetical protein